MAVTSTTIHSYYGRELDVRGSIKQKSVDGEMGKM